MAVFFDPDEHRVLSLERISEDELKIHCSQQLVESLAWVWDLRHFERYVSVNDRGIRRLCAALFEIRGIEKLHFEKYSLRIYKGKAIVADSNHVERRILDECLSHMFGTAQHISKVEILIQTKDGQDAFLWEGREPLKVIEQEEGP